MGVIFFGVPGLGRGARSLGYLLATIVGVTAGDSMARAAGPTDKERGAAAKTAAQLRSAGDLSAARAHLAGCVSAGCSRQVREECGRQLEAIEAAIPAVVLEAKDEASNNMSSVRVTM